MMRSRHGGCLAPSDSDSSSSNDVLRRSFRRDDSLPSPPPDLPRSGWRPPRHAALLTGLALTRIIGWGTTYWAPSVLVFELHREIGLSPAVVFGGVTVLLVTGALIAPALGRYFDRRGTRRAMSVGALICALGLAALAGSQGPISYLASWIVIGIGHAMTLANVGNVTIAQLMGDRTRRVIGLMMVVGGLSSTVFWPVATMLTEAFGWRMALLTFAAMHLFIVLPIHLCIPRYRQAPVQGRTGTEPPAATESGRVPPADRRAVFWLVALVFSISGLVSWGLPLHLISLLQNAGLDQQAAVGIASLGGPAVLVSRLTEIAIGERIRVEMFMLAGLIFGPLACLILALGPGSFTLAVIFVLMFNAAMGVIAVARATLPLVLFGRQGFGAMLGRLTVPQNLAFAMAPLLFAWLIELLGAAGALLVSGALQAVALAAMLALLGRLRRS